MRIRQVSATVLALVAVTACNGDDDATSTTALPSSTTEVVETTVPESTQPPTTAGTTAPPTTDRPDTTTSTIDATTPPTDPATTSIPNDDFAAQAVAVIERTEQSWAVVLEAFADPFDDEKVAALDGYFTGNQLEGFRNLIDEFREGNFRSVRRPDMVEVYDADPRSLALSLDSGFATVQVCHVDTSLIVETGGNPDGSDRVVSDAVEQEIVELDVELVDDVWKVASARAPETEIATCP